MLTSQGALPVRRVQLVARDDQCLRRARPKACSPRSGSKNAQPWSLVLFGPVGNE